MSLRFYNFLSRFHEVAENQIMYNLDCTGLEMTIQDCSVTETTECISGHLEAECELTIQNVHVYTKVDVHAMHILNVL